MPGRPRTISDERIMAAVAEAVGRVGPARLTLADVARAAGVSTGALVQRYGSKRNLLLAFSGRSGGLAAAMRAAYQNAPDPVEGLLRAVILGTDAEQSPEQFANHLAFLHLELADPQFRELLARHAAEVRCELEHYVREAVDEGRLATPDVAALAAAVDAIRNGTRLTWAMHRQGELADALRRDLGTLLAPYLTNGESK
jgi:AcrR family transcriptional regulator